jgi:hypothetical protein
MKNCNINMKVNILFVVSTSVVVTGLFTNVVISAIILVAGLIAS